MKRVPYLDAGNKVKTVHLGGAGADTTKFLRGDQTWAIPSGGGGPSIIKKGVDQTNNTSNLVGDTELKFQVPIHTDFFFEFFIGFISNNIANGIHLDLLGPSTPLSCAWWRKTALGLSSFSENQLYGYGTDVATPSVETANKLFFATMIGVLRNDMNSGQLQLMFANEVEGNIVIIKKGSILRYSQI